jgi:MFS family permease
LRTSAFRWFWFAVLISNIGTWIDATAAAWVMGELAPSPLMVSLVQAATSLPMVLLALPAGSLADIVDRRRFLIAMQIWMLIAALLLAIAAFTATLTAPALLWLTLLLNIGAALALPAMAATTPELVPREQLASAVALNSLGINIARAIGPALGGWILVQLGAGWAFAINAATFLAVIAVFVVWRRAPAASRLPPENFVGALQAGVRYAALAPAFRAVLIRALAFFLFASAAMGLLPSLIRFDLRLSANVYGVAMTAMGLGAIAGALLLPLARARISRSRLVFAATMIFAAAMVALALSQRPLQVYLALATIGIAWIAVLASLQVAAQTAVAGWVRARALAIYLTAYSTGMLVGSVVWGWLAGHIGVSLTLQVAAAGLALAGLLTTRFDIDEADQLQLMPSAHWPAPHVADPIPDERGPVLVTIEYRVRAEARGEFLRLVERLGTERRRDGALSWGVFEDVAEANRFTETMTVGSWLEHLRQHERVTEDARQLQQAIRTLLLAGSEPLVRHLIGGADQGPLSKHGAALDA